MGRPVVEFSANTGYPKEGGELTFGLGQGMDPRFLEERSAHVTLSRGDMPPDRLVVHTPVDEAARDIQAGGYNREEIAGFLPSYAVNPALDSSGVTPKAIMYHLGVTGPEVPEEATG
jgi:hypothetical protein